ncbi:MAG: DUF1385 domain-containing protein [Deltaproteobacteria bacterium]|jgi:uncharacterized protein YqhQ|nr:DUF1385 domain-containing protein [Deltaproteobacteria bacterium]
MTTWIERALKKALLVLPNAVLSAQSAPPGDAPPAPPGVADGQPEPQKNVGGQAVIEGVMMRGRDSWAVMVREPDGGITGQTKPHKAWNRRAPWKYPFLRGLAVLLESLVLGIKALNYSTEVAVSSIEEQEKAKKAEKKALKDAKNGIVSPPEAPDLAKAKPGAEAKKSHTLEIVLGLTVGIGLGVVLFVALPHVLSFWLGQIGGFDESTFLFHLLDGLLKFGIFLAYIYLIGLIPDIARVYAYHGAEHQAIHVYEAGLPLEPSSAKAFPTWHRRCGTAFLFLVLAASLLFFAIVFPLLPSFDGLSRVPRILAGVGIKILLTPLLAAMAYEVTKLASRPNSGPVWRAMVWPGLLLQRLTTRKPDDSMLEVAFRSLTAVLPGKTAPGA